MNISYNHLDIEGYHIKLPEIVMVDKSSNIPGTPGWLQSQYRDFVDRVLAGRSASIVIGGKTLYVEGGKKDPQAPSNPESVALIMDDNTKMPNPQKKYKTSEPLFSRNGGNSEGAGNTPTIVAGGLVDTPKLVTNLADFEAGLDDNEGRVSYGSGLYLDNIKKKKLNHKPFNSSNITTLADFEAGLDDNEGRVSHGSGLYLDNIKKVA